MLHPASGESKLSKDKTECAIGVVTKLGTVMAMSTFSGGGGIRLQINIMIHDAYFGGSVFRPMGKLAPPSSTVRRLGLNIGFWFIRRELDGCSGSASLVHPVFAPVTVDSFPHQA